MDDLASQVRSATLLNEKPELIQSIKSAYEAMQPDQTVTIAGRIYAESVSPFDEKESSFSLIELPRPGHNHEDPGDCPFCKRELRNAKFAIVKVVDESGNTFQQPADRLLGLTKNQDVVVAGRVSSVGETMVVRARLLHVLSKDDAQTLSVAFHHNANSSQDSETEANNN